MLPIPRKIWVLQTASMVPIMIVAAAAWVFTLSLVYVSVMHFVDGEIGPGIGVLVAAAILTPIAQGIASFVGSVLGAPFAYFAERTEWGRAEPSSDKEAREVEESLGRLGGVMVVAVVVLTVIGFGLVLAVGALDQWT